MTGAFDPDMIKLLVCPLSKAELVHHGDLLVSKDKTTRRAYEIVDGIPDLLIEHSRELTIQEWEDVFRQIGQ